MDNTLHKQEFRIRDLATRSVTLFPTRAQIVREIKDVQLKPGQNEITVVGVTPTADEHSIKVEGSGSAIITDITVELLPNRDIFQEIYPDDDDESSSDSSEESDLDEEDSIDPALEEVREKIAAISEEQNRAREVVFSAENRMRILDAYGKSLDKKKGVDIETGLETYRKEREKVYQDQSTGTTSVKDLQKQLDKLRREETRLERIMYQQRSKADRVKAKAQRAKDRLKEKERRREAERKKEKTRIRKEREQFWPRSCYSVRITLDAVNFTPSSSRRSSIASLTDVKLVSEKAAASGSDDGAAGSSAAGLLCDLSLSYVTSSAFWSPSYDLALSTIQNTATLCFDARLTNMTSETWSNSKVILSTSQATFSGLQDEIPTLVPWRLKLAGRGIPWDAEDVICSREERAEKEVWKAAKNALVQQKPRAQLFGFGSLEPAGQVPDVETYMQPNMAMQVQNVVAAAQQAQQQIAFQRRGLDDNVRNISAIREAPGGGANSGSLQAASMAYRKKSIAPKPSLKSKSAKVGTSRFMAEGPVFEGGDDSSNGEEEEEEDEDAATMLEATPELSFQDSSFEETGLTATYDLPGLKTLRPSTTASKQRVARISFAAVLFSRTVVAKYKPVAYLKARLRNTSKITLLKGPTGLTLDGTFMGRSTLPRCSAGDSFQMPLGVDPAIKVSYPKPEVKRSTTGVFTKGDNSLYTRTITLVNTRATANKPVNITVLDQVPISEDEKLRVDLHVPRGMVVNGQGVATGVPGKDGKDEREWGRALAQLKKAGEVTWDVQLNAGRSCKLTLEYEISLPNGERVAQCY